jgi:hypothetical protein
VRSQNSLAVEPWGKCFSVSPKLHSATRSGLAAKARPGGRKYLGCLDAAVCLMAASLGPPFIANLDIACRLLDLEANNISRGEGGQATKAISDPPRRRVPGASSSAPIPVGSLLVEVLPGSFMTGQTRWVVYGGIAAVAGVGVLWTAKTPTREVNPPCWCGGFLPDRCWYPVDHEWSGSRRHLRFPGSGTLILSVN